MEVIACVLKTGGWRNANKVVTYKPEHVQWLQRMVTQHVTIPHRFVCLSDVEINGVETIPLQDDLPGWWSKIELFREFRECLFLDLDTVVVGDVTHILTHEHQFTALRGMTRSRELGSGLLAWRGDYSHLYHKFMDNPKYWMFHCRRPMCWGDQGFIQMHVGEFQRFQDIWPGQVLSYKVHLKGGNPPDDCRIVAFHGTPKPWDVRKHWIPELWPTALN